jgi:hypothetical protein
MLFRTLRIYKYVVNENHNELVQLRHEYGVHEVHEVCRCICQHKQQDKILVESVSRSESSLGDIFGTDLNLVITEVEINLGEHLGFH